MADIEVKRIPRIDVQAEGAAVGTRPRINFVEGTNVTITATDNAVSDRVDVEIAASGGGGSPAGSDTQIQYNNSGAFGASAALAWNNTDKILTLGLASEASEIRGAAGDAISPDGTRLTLKGGAPFDDGIGGAASGGGVTILGNAGINGGSGGNYEATGGASDSGSGGQILFVGGASTSGPGGFAAVRGGNADSGTPGGVEIQSGSAQTEGPGADVYITASNGVADANPNQNGGNVNITVGTATGSGTPGVLAITNTGSAAGTGNVTVGNVAPGTTAIAVTAWMRITVDGTPYLLPLFS